MATVRVENIDDARKLGPKYDVEFPTGKGRPPLRALAAAILEAGDTIDDSPYFNAAMADRNWQRNQHKADLEAIVAAGKDALSVAETLLAKLVSDETNKPVRVLKSSADVKYQVKATVPNKSGKGKRPAKVTLTVAEIREATNNVGVRGRVSQSNVIAAAAVLKSWGPVDKLTNVSVERLGDPADKPSETVAAGPVESVETDTPAGVDDVVSVELSDSSAEDADAKLSVLDTVNA